MERKQLTEEQRIERVKVFAKAELEEGFSNNPNYVWAIVGQSGTVYQFGIEDHREEAEEFCAPVDTRDEPLFLFDRAAVEND